jgi:hypothetical protein
MTNRALPEPGVDVFVQLRTEARAVLRPARLNEYGTDFVLASYPNAPGIPVRLADVQRWDYAVPAGDLL